MFSLVLFSLLSTSSSASVNISECRNLNVSGTTYLLNQSVNSGGSCMNITAENIALDCQGYLINYSQSKAGYGVNNSDGFNDVTVRNCVIVQGGNFSSAYAIHFKNASQATIEYNNIETYDDATTLGKNGINLENTTNSRINNNVIKTQAGIEANLGISLYQSSYNNLTNNDITTTGYLGYGINLHESTYNRVLYNNIDTTDQASGIVLYKNSTNNIVKGNNITTTDLWGCGIYIESSYNNLTENRISTSNTDAYGIHIYGDSDNNIIMNSIIKSMQSIGIYLQHFGASIPENNLFYNNLINGSSLPVNLSSSVGNNTWNTTEQDGTRIYSAGNRIGGNYYTNSTGGYSDTCVDSDEDGFCDLPYNLSTWNIDYLPLSDGYKPPAPTTTTTLYIPPRRRQDSSGGGVPYTAKPKPTCFDGILNCHDGSCEAEVDCGGPCKPCATCLDGIQNNGEEGVDCGGYCPPCNVTTEFEEVIVEEEIPEIEEEKEEMEVSDPCSNGVLDGKELGVDCGGLCGPCRDGEFCILNSGCISGWCYNQVCKTSSCFDGIKGLGETGIDCGGSCGKCPSLDVDDSCVVGESISIRVSNPVQGMTVLITDPYGGVKSYGVLSSAGSSAVLTYSPMYAGEYYIKLNGYPEEAIVVVKEKEIEQSTFTIKMEWILILALFAAIAFILHEEKKNRVESDEWNHSVELLKLDSAQKSHH